MAYTPTLSKEESATVRRIAWAVKKPMTKTLAAIIKFVTNYLDGDKICTACKDDSRCDSCLFGLGESGGDHDLFNKITIKMESEVTMHVEKINVLVSKKVGKNFCSWSISHGASADLKEDEDYKDIIETLDYELKMMVAKSLPTNFPVHTAVLPGVTGVVKEAEVIPEKEAINVG